MAEEHGFQSPDGHRLCHNNCGFFGSSATLNLCSKCFRDHSTKDQARSAVENTQFLAAVVPPAPSSASGTSRFSAAARPNRCSMCRKRVGLTGFECRCGTTFCGAHRYPEQHGCTFDYKAVGREAIARANPVVKADKLEKV